MRIPYPPAFQRLLIGLFGSLFWRTFMLIALLIVISMAAWFQSVRIFERAPRERQIAVQIASVVKLTRAALRYAEPPRRRFLLLDLVQNEGLKVYPREREDEYLAPRTNPYLTQLAQREILDRLGPRTIIAAAVNGIPGVWVSFQIDSDNYWVAISPDRFAYAPGLQWLGWSIATLVLSMLGAALITSRVNQPLKRLADTARAVSAGNNPQLLPEGGGTEVARAFRSFNQMVRNLQQLETDRVVMLAGISHDLRTPLTRLRLETEMSPADRPTRDLMVADIEQMDAIIGQFLDYARPGDRLEALDLSRLVRDMAPAYAAHDDIEITLELAPDAIALGNRMETRRVLDNLVENARRYGKTPNTGRAQITLSTALQDREAILCVADRGAGVPDSQLAMLTRPFYRLESARSEARGAGLGISIVHRILQHSGGKLILKNRAAPETGLIVSACYQRA